MRPEYRREELGAGVRGKYYAQYQQGATMRLEQEGPVRRPLQYDCLKGRIWTADDFDAPLDDFKEYM